MTQTIGQPKKQKFINIDGDVAAVLRDRLQYDGNNVRIGGPRLDPKLYKSVDNVLQQFGGKWKSGKLQAHVFAECPKAQIEDAIGAGKVLDKKQSYQFFETPAEIADKLVEYADFAPGMLALEPSAGRGAIVAAINRASWRIPVDVVEIDESHCDHWTHLGISGVMIGDFLKAKPIPTYDRVVMNPPFSGGQDAEHVIHAFKFLKPGGRLVAIVGDGICTRSDKQAREFQKFVEEHVVHEEILDNGAFKESGTMSRSRIVVLAK